MDAETIFFTLFVIWYFKQFHSSHHLIVSSIHFLKTAQDSINHYNELIRKEISNYNGDSASANDSESDTSDVESAPDTVVVKYEDKYLQEVRRMEREFHFDNDADFSSKTMECLEPHGRHSFPMCSCMSGLNAYPFLNWPFTARTDGNFCF